MASVMTLTASVRNILDTISYVRDGVRDMAVRSGFAVVCVLKVNSTSVSGE
jgi:hypothetical protein